LRNSIIDGKKENEKDLETGKTTINKNKNDGQKPERKKKTTVDEYRNGKKRRK